MIVTNCEIRPTYMWGEEALHSASLLSNPTRGPWNGQGHIIVGVFTHVNGKYSCQPLMFWSLSFIASPCFLPQ